MVTRPTTTPSYDAKDIQTLKGLEAVRKRPGMYIGTTGSPGLHHLVWEIVDNSIDEAMMGYCDHIEVEILPGDIVVVTDNGRGIPVGLTNEGINALESVFTVLHSGGKFGGKGYKSSGGLHGVGASVVNALSLQLRVEVIRDGKKYVQEYVRGEKQFDVRQEPGYYEGSGTKVIFKPDPEIFKETTEFDFGKLEYRLQQCAFLNSGVKMTLIDRRQAEVDSVEFLYEGGIQEYVAYLNRNKSVIHPDIIYMKDVVDGESGSVEIEIAMQYTDTYNSTIMSFINNVVTPDGGTHEDGFKTRLTTVLNRYAKDAKLQKGENINGEDAREGLTAIIVVRHPDPQFEGQTKTKLGNVEVRAFTSQALGTGLSRFLEENPEQAKEIFEKTQTAQRARIAAARSREMARRKSPLEGLDFASKLADCRDKDPVNCEIFIVEGDSAGGSARQGRDSGFQAILPLRGKVLNVEKKRDNEALKNKEIASMIRAFGVGIREELDINKARYHKIIIMTDADIDGAHIRTLLLTFLYRFQLPLIEAGYVYIAQPPLFKVSHNRRVEYVYSDAELEAILETFPASSRPVIQRYKGLGEMNPEQLWETTMDPEQRTLIQVTIDDAAEANQVFATLMGEEVEPRRNFIQTNAKRARDIDF